MVHYLGVSDREHVLNSEAARDRFIEALAREGSVRGALRATGEACTYVYRARAIDREFDAAWARLVPPTPAWRTRPRRSAKAGWRDRVIEGLSETGNQRRAARIAGVSRQLIEQERRRNDDFAVDCYNARHDGRIEVLLARAGSDLKDLASAFRSLELNRTGHQQARIRPRRDEAEPEPHPLCPAATLRVPPPAKGRPGKRDAP